MGTVVLFLFCVVFYILFIHAGLFIMNTHPVSHGASHCTLDTIAKYIAMSPHSKSVLDPVPRFRVQVLYVWSVLAKDSPKYPHVSEDE